MRGYAHHQVTAAMHLLGELKVSLDGVSWTELEEDLTAELLEDWRRAVILKEGPRFQEYVVSLAKGQEVSSPICPSFRYRVAGLAGQQKQLFDSSISYPNMRLPRED